MKEEESENKKIWKIGAKVYYKKKKNKEKKTSLAPINISLNVKSLS